MHKKHTLASILLVIVMGVVIGMPFSVSAALGTSFGGKVLWALPCAIPLGSFYVTIKPAMVSPVVNYVWTPVLTDTKLIGPPVLPNQYLLGVADIPLSCTIVITPVGCGFFGTMPCTITLFGQRMQVVGTSAPTLTI